MTIKIILPEGDKPRTPIGTKVVNDTGAEIRNITRIELDLSLDNVISARIDVNVSSIENMDNVLALLGVDTLEDIASLHGYKMVPLDNG